MPTPSVPGRIKELARDRLYEQTARELIVWMLQTKMAPGDKLPAERDLCEQLGISRATLAQALVALEVTGVVQVLHGSGTFLRSVPTADRAIATIRSNAVQHESIIEARQSIETSLAELAAIRRTQEDLKRMEAALEMMQRAVDAGERGLGADEEFHNAVAAAAQSDLLHRLMTEISDHIRETRVESLSQARLSESLEDLHQIYRAIRGRKSNAAAKHMRDHISRADRKPTDV